MEASNVDRMFETAVQHHQAGRLREAESLYQQIIAAYPRHVDSIHNFGVLALQLGRGDIAAVVLRRAVALRPGFADAHSNLGNALLGLGELDEAIAAYRTAVALRPGFLDALNNLGVALQDKKQFTDAISVFRQALKVAPDYVEAYYNLGMALNACGKSSEAIDVYRRAISLRPDYAEARCNLGNLLKEAGRQEDAIAEYQRACALKPGFALAHYNLGTALMDKGAISDAIAEYLKAISILPDYAEAHNNLGHALNTAKRHEEALAACRRAIANRPDFAAAHNNLGVALRETGQLDGAVEAFQRAVELDPKSADALSNLGSGLRARGELDEALAAYRRAMELNPQSHLAWSNYLFALHFHPSYDPLAIAREHRIWESQCTGSLRAFVHPKARATDSDRPLRIGYVSPDFTGHPVGRFMVPILAHHNRSKFEIHCFSNVTAEDQFSILLRQTADHWHNIAGMSDDSAAELIRKQRIDVLVDLALHTAGNRLPVFARKPAPVQVTHLAYCGSSGLRSIDYALCDPFLVPADTDEQSFAETPFRLPRTFWCYRPPDGLPEPGDSPAQAVGQVTFGSLNNFGKVSAEAIQAWCKILARSRNSRLILHVPTGIARERVADQIRAAGVEISRVSFVDRVRADQYFKAYLEIDIALDTSPFSGGTTTCDALWMGVPTVSLVGNTPVSRGGLSILTNAGLPELVTRSTQEYVKVAAELAADLPRLANLRATLRQRMRASPLMDEEKYVADLEAAYRAMWVSWCQGGGSGQARPSRAV